MIEILWLVLYFIIAIIVGGFLFFGLIFGAMYTRIPTKKLAQIIKLGELNADKVVYDLGAGLGTIAFEASYGGAGRVVAVEIDPIKVALMKLLLSYNNRLAKAMSAAPPVPGMKRTPYLNVEIVRSNLAKVDLATADVVYCYLSPALMPIVGEKAQKEMKAGTKVISVEHKINSWLPNFSDEKEKIYVYEVGKIEV